MLDGRLAGAAWLRSFVVLHCHAGLGIMVGVRAQGRAPAASCSRFTRVINRYLHTPGYTSK